MVAFSLKSKQNGSAHMIFVAVAVLAVIVGAAAYVLTGGFGTKTITATTATEVKELIASAQAGEYDAKCTYSSKDADANGALLATTGTTTLYVKGEKKRIDATVSGQDSHFLQVDDSMYVWADGKDKGSKFPITKKDGDSADKFAENVEKYQITCESASLDDALFEQPSDVTFTEPKAQFESSSPSN